MDSYFKFSFMHSKKNLLIIKFILFFNFIFSQEKYTVIDSLSKDPISYANIWINNEIFTNSNEKGSFIIENKNGKVILKN